MSQVNENHLKRFELVEFDKEKKYVKDFVDLARRLYSAKDNMEDPNQMRSILMGEHPLCKNFELRKFLVYEKVLSKAVGRFAITTYSGDENAYIGFFECVDDKEAAAFLFQNADRICKELGYHKIVGPVDGSFWIKYRLKTNRFNETPYTGEPYNKNYYFKLFTENGYEVAEHYVSNDYDIISKDYVNPKFKKRFDDFTSRGYEIISPTKDTFDEIIGEVYRMITELYRTFPIYKDLDEETFRDMFKSYKSIMNMDMTKIAYYQGKAVAFYISIPDYGNIVYHLSPVNVIKLLKTRKNPDKFIMLYMGVEKEHLGLGAAMIHVIQEELKRRGVPSIGALCRDGKVTRYYESCLITDSYEYVLMSKEI